MSNLVLHIFSVFPVGPGCIQQSSLVERGNEERCVSLGRLIGGESNRSGVLRVPFCAFVVLNEAGVGLDECL
jgi:hypothetical protein